MSDEEQRRFNRLYAMLRESDGTIHVSPEVRMLTERLNTGCPSDVKYRLAQAETLKRIFEIATGRPAKRFKEVEDAVLIAEGQQRPNGVLDVFRD